MTFLTFDENIILILIFLSTEKIQKDQTTLQVTFSQNYLQISLINFSIQPYYFFIPEYLISKACFYNFSTFRIQSTRLCSFLFSFCGQIDDYQQFIAQIVNYIVMPERKVWTVEQDRVLKFLIEQRGLSKWSQISRVMEQQFSILGRNGKQCRERYHNHLDRNIKNDEWTIEEENLLFDMQDEMGNKWALISSKLPGRTDNCVKNHFYSKLRKSLRKVNKKIHKYMKKEYKDIKTSTLYRIIQTMENRNKLTQNIQVQTYELCKNIKKQLRKYQEQIQTFQDIHEELTYVRNIIQDISVFDKDIKKNTKNNNLKSSAKLSEEDSSLKPKSWNSKVSSTKSVYDDQSESYSNSEMFSSSSIDQRSFRSQRLVKPNKIFRSHSIKSQSQQNDSIGQQDILYKSANSLCPKRSPLKVEVNKQIELERRRSLSSQKSKKSQNSSNDCNRMYMWGEQSLQMRVISPRKLTIQQKMEMTEQNDQLFYGQMQVQNQFQQHQKLIQDFSDMKLGIFGIPKLGKVDFD